MLGFAQDVDRDLRRLAQATTKCDLIRRSENAERWRNPSSASRVGSYDLWFEGAVAP
jgi:hypothetical protein